MKNTARADYVNLGTIGLGRSFLTAAVLAAALLFLAPSRLHAEDIDRCQRRVAAC